VKTDEVGALDRHALVPMDGSWIVHPWWSLAA
jgi:hypothetical protein